MNLFTVAAIAVTGASTSVSNPASGGAISPLALSSEATPYIQLGSFIVAALAMVVTAYYSRMRYVHDERSRSVSASIVLMKEWRDDHTQAALAFVHEELAKKYPDARSVGYLGIEDAADRRKVMRVSHLCDEIAARAIAGEANLEFIVSILGPAIVRAKESLWPYLEAERRRRAQRAGLHDDPFYQGDFVEFATLVKHVDTKKIALKRYRRLKKMRILKRDFALDGPDA